MCHSIPLSQLLGRFHLPQAGVLQEEREVDHVSQVSVTTNACVSELLVQVQFNGLDDHMGVDGKDDNEWRPRIREQCVHSVKDAQDFSLLNAVKTVDHYNQTGLLASEGVQALHHLLQQCHLSFDCLQVSWERGEG